MESNGSKRDARTAARVGGVVATVLMMWSLVAGTPSHADETQVAEPSELSAYATLSDAMPVQSYFDHQARLVPLGPAIAHSQAEIAMPSASSGIAWLVDNGVANGLHGTTTGNRVPTEASAKQPGGAQEDQYLVAGGPIGSNNFASARAGRAYARADRGDAPEGYANAFLNDFAVLPAAGSPDDAPGTFDPDARYPGDPNKTDPAPRGRMAIVSVGSIASNARSVRDGSTVTSVGIATLKDVNIGNRTSDNRCTNCITFDSIRVEAFAEAAGQPNTSRAAYRVILGRACRRAFNADAGVEKDECLPLDPHDPEGNSGLQSINELDALNKQFEQPIWSVLTNGQINYAIGIRIHAGQSHCSPARAQRTVSPKDDPCRNYAYPDNTPRDGEHRSQGVVNPDQDQGQVANAVAEGLDVEMWTITFSQAWDDGEKRLAGTPAGPILKQADQDPSTPGTQICLPGPLCDQTGMQTIPTDSVRAVRRAQITLGVARATATARPAFVAGVAPTSSVPGTSVLGDFTTRAPETGLGPAIGGQTGGGGLGAGPYRLHIDWSSIRLKPWPPYDMAKAIAAGAIIGGVVWLMKRRIRLRAT